MKRLTFATLIALAALPSGAAWAQPDDLEPTPPQPHEEDVEEPPAPKRDEPRVIKVMTAPPSTVEPTAPPPVQRRPPGGSIGIGVGWNFPTDLQVPNAFSARFRLASGLTAEPELALRRGDLSREDGLPPPENITTTQLTLGITVRKPLRERNRADLELLGSIRIAQDSFDPEGEENTDSAVDFSINYGLAVGVWVTPHVQVSMSALNPIFAASKTTDEQGIGIDPIKTTTTSIGAVWQPDFIAMVHLYL